MQYKNGANINHECLALVPTLRISADMHRSSEFQGERGYFLGHSTEFAVLEIVEKGGILLTTSVKSSNKGSYPNPH